MKNENKRPLTREERCQMAISQAQALRATGMIRHLGFRRLWQMSNCLLAGGKYADAARAQIDRIVTPMQLAGQYMPTLPPKIPAVPAEFAILLGHEIGTNRPVVIHRDKLAHTLLVGQTGMGKSRVVYSIVDQIVKQNAMKCGDAAESVAIQIMDYKGESASLLNMYPDQIGIFRPDQLPRNILQPKGHARSYLQGLFAVIQRHTNLRPETWTGLPGIVMRMLKSLRATDPGPSLVDLEKYLRSEAEVQERSNLHTASRSIANLITILGESARIRHSSASLSPITVVRFDGLHKRTAELLLSLNILSDGVFAEPPPTSSRQLRRLRCEEDMTFLVCDDTSSSSDLANSPLTQSFLNCAWLGEAIIGSVQAVTLIKPVIVNNVKTWLFFSCPEPRQAQRASQIVGGDERMAQAIQRLPPQHFVAYSEGFEGPVICRAPNFSTGPRPSEQAIADHMKPVFAQINRQLILSPPFEGEPADPIVFLEDTEPDPSTCEREASDPMQHDPGILADYARFMQVITASSNLSARELTATLGMSAGKVTRLKAELARHGFITIHKEPGSTGRPRLIVQITAKGAEFLRKWSSSS